MTGVENVTEPHSMRPNTLRVRRHRHQSASPVGRFHKKYNTAMKLIAR
jgi:hypothetical protein